MRTSWGVGFRRKNEKRFNFALALKAAYPMDGIVIFWIVLDLSTTRVCVITGGGAQNSFIILMVFPMSTTQVDRDNITVFKDVIQRAEFLPGMLGRLPPNEGIPE